jgi:hypothetical protein
VERFRKSVALIVCSLVGCASTQFDEVTPSSSFQGAAFWIYPAEVAKAPFVFRWHGDQAYVSTDARSRRKTISISRCPNLRGDLAKLDASVIPSVQAITTPQAKDLEQLWVGHIRYALKYVSEHSVDELRLESYEPYSVPWVAAAVAVRDRVIGCLAGN